VPTTEPEFKARPTTFEIVVNLKTTKAHGIALLGHTPRVRIERSFAALQMWLCKNARYVIHSAV
jgi:hypothetical protein